MSGGENAAWAVWTLELVTPALVVMTAALYWVWWVHSGRGLRFVTREVGAYLLLIGAVRAYWNFWQGLVLFGCGIGLWVLARRLRGRPLDDRAVMGRSAAGRDDDEDDG